MPIGFAKLAIGSTGNEQLKRIHRNAWSPHYNTGGYEGGWEVMTLRSPAGNANNIHAETLGQGAYADTQHMQGFPLIKELLGTLQCEIMSVRLLNLKSGGVIKEHRDFDLAFELGEVRLHFPLITNEAVEFYVNDTRLKMLPGQCWYINANLPHRVVNNGSTDRIHLVVDCKVNKWLENVFEAAEKTEFEDPLNVAQTLMVIESLRLLKTATGNDLAGKLERDLMKLK